MADFTHNLRAATRTGTLWVTRLIRSYSFVVALLLAVVLLVANILMTKSFGWTQQLATFAPLAIAAMAMTPQLISGNGGFDMTVSPLMIFCGIFFVVVLVPAGLGGWIALPITLVVGMLLGAFTGSIIALLRIPPMVATLSLYFIYLGIDLKVCPYPVSLPLDHWLPKTLGSIGPIPGALFYILAPLVIWVLLGRIPYRRMLFLVGSNDVMAYASGIKVNAVRIGAYALGGLFSAIAGLAYTGLVSSADPASASRFVLSAVAAVALGGTALFGGRGGLLGSLLGAACIYLLDGFLKSMHVRMSWIQLIYGLMLVLAVVVGAMLSRAKKGEQT